MKLQAIELPLGKPQPRRKAPKLGPLIALTLLFTIIPIYYPSLRYSVKKLSQTSSSFDHVDDSIRPTGLLEPFSQENNEPCRVHDVAGHPCNPSQGDILAASKLEKTKGGVETQPSNNEDEPEAVGSSEKNVDKRSNSNKHDLTIEKASDKDSQTWSSPGEHDQVTLEKSERRGRKRPTKRLPSNDDSRTSHVSDSENCDIFSGEWVPNPEAPYYTNTTCWAIQQHQNCLKFGRPDTGFMKWRWKPDGCELPVFDPHQFLELVRGKSIAFVGDSVARNHMQSLICLLSRVVYPLDISNTNDENFKRWIYPDYNFNISIFWAPYLVRTARIDPNDITRPFKLFLDEFDEEWTSKIEPFNYVIISAGHWFFRPTNFYVNRQLVGCLYCPDAHITHHQNAYFSYRRAFRTALRAINSLENFKGITFLRTFAPSHFEGGPWDKGGDCARTSPFKRNETVLDDYNLEMYKIQLQELKIAQKVGRKRGLKFRLFDATQPMLLRPDGHPSKYGRWPVQNVTVPNDCVHWCLPGPIDTWNDFLQELLRREVEDRSFT